MKRMMRTFWMGWAGAVALVLLTGFFMLKGKPLGLLFRTSDQYAQRAALSGRFNEAAKWYTSANRQGTALFRAGEFKDAGNRFAGDSTAEGFYNGGVALAMQGKYKEAVQRFEQALALNPEWDDAQMNLEIANQLAARLEQKGGNSTEGQLGADDFVFSDKKSSSPEDSFDDESADASNSGAQKAIWLRQVQTRPVDFLRAKFSYQTSMPEVERQ